MSQSSSLGSCLSASVPQQSSKLLMDMQHTVLKAFIEKKEIKVNLKYNLRGKDRKINKINYKVQKIPGNVHLCQKRHTNLR